MPSLSPSLCGPRWRDRPGLCPSGSHQLPFPKLCPVNQRLGARKPKKMKEGLLYICKLLFLCYFGTKTVIRPHGPLQWASHPRRQKNRTATTRCFPLGIHLASHRLSPLPPRSRATWIINPKDEHFIFSKREFAASVRSS